MLNPRIVAILDGIGAQVGREIRVTRGFVTYADAEREYVDYKEGKRGPTPKPSESVHATGNAVDIHVDDIPAVHEYAEGFGLVCPRPEEPWHWELA